MIMASKAISFAKGFRRTLLRLNSLRVIVQQGRCSENTSVEIKETYATPKEQLTPQLTPDSRKDNQTHTQNIPDDLAEIVTVWPGLSEAIRSAIVAIVRSSNKQ